MEINKEGIKYDKNKPKYANFLLDFKDVFKNYIKYMNLVQINMAVRIGNN